MGGPGFGGARQGLQEQCSRKVGEQTANRKFSWQHLTHMQLTGTRQEQKQRSKKHERQSLGFYDRAS